MRVAIVGCGQLSQMLAQAGIPIGLKFSFVAEPDEDTRCVDGLGEVVRYQQGAAIGDLFEQLQRPDVITVEKEQVDSVLLRSLSEYCAVYPDADSVAVCQHRYREKQLLDSLEIANAPYVYGVADAGCIDKLGLPCVVKSCSEGYDGKNQWILKTPDDVDAFRQQEPQGEYIVEQWIPFEREISQVSMRTANGEIKHYPLAENLHENGILKQSVAPAEAVSDQLAFAAKDYISRIMDRLNYVGVMAMECFVASGKLMVNELAPRVHNSGHWTQAGSKTSQFENHLRAITGMALGSVQECSITGMLNLIGCEKPANSSLPDYSTLHWYNKVVRSGRKLGHINFTSTSHKSLLQKMQEVKRVAGVGSSKIEGLQ